MEEKKTYRADLEHKRPQVFAIALVAVATLFIGILFIPFKNINEIGADLLDDYSMDLDLKANEQDDMISAAIPQQQETKQESDQYNKVDNTTELPPENIDQTAENTDEETTKEEETAEEQPLINMNGDDKDKLRIVEELPEYPGGMVEFMKWLTKTLKYPDTALKQKQQGKVMISFIVEKDGTLTELKVIKSAGKIFDEEALRVARLMPQWKPGKAEGKPCRTMITIPIVFDI